MKTKMRFAALVAAGLLCLGVPSPAAAQEGGLTTTDLSTGTANDLAQTLAGPGVTVSNVQYSGAPNAGGEFAGGTGIIGFEDGVILSSGSVSNVVGPNVEDGITTSNGTPGDQDLTDLSGVWTNDAAVLEFDFVPNKGEVSFRYVFSSDEYNEYVNSSFNDVFAFFVNGQNCATVAGDAVSINTINNGNPYGSGGPNSALYRNNDLSDEGGTINTEMDGLTTVLTCVSAVNANQTNHMRLAIADGSDSVLDSNVFIKADSLTTEPEGCGEDGLDALGDLGVASGTVHGLEGTLDGLSAGLGEQVHGVNCDVVVPLEDTVDGLLGGRRAFRL